MVSDEIIMDLPKALINWHDFPIDSETLFVSGGMPECETLYNALREKDVSAKKADLNKLNTVEGSFDYIVAVGIVERSEKPEEILTALRGLLKASGKFLLGAENRLGIRYFCGDKDPFTRHVFDGIDGYIRVSGEQKKINGGRAYAKAEYEKMLLDAGFSNYRFYAVMPELAYPQMLIADGYIPNEAVNVRVFPQYRNPGTLFLEEERLYEALIENNMFHQMANAFLIECTINGELSDIDQITVQNDRGRDEALATLIKRSQWVVKKALYPEGKRKIAMLRENENYLRKHGISMAQGELEKDVYVTPYIDGQIATEYFRDTLRKDKQMFIGEMEAFRNTILSSSDHVSYEEVNWLQFEPWCKKRKGDDPNIDQWEKRAFGTEEERESIGVILKRGYIDLVSINCFHTGEGLVFFDQEFYIENFPANAIFIRTVDFIYRDSPDLEKIYPKEELLKRFGLYEHQKTWRGRGNEFLEKLRKERELSAYHKLRRRDGNVVASNRQRMDYSQEEYERLFTNIFRGADSRKIYLFGSGRYAGQFIKQFGQYYEIAGIVDNNQERWEESLQGIPIFSPSVLTEEKAPFKVFVCIKFFEDVLAQLRGMGIKDISVYNPQLDYERPSKRTSNPQEDAPKQYHVGYVAGVFDLFHIGHLNILRRAKEQCDYLIVGVVSDEQVINRKKTRPSIPFGERLAIVQACRYVDEAVEIPADKPDTESAWRMYHFDVQFSGSDYENDPIWLAKKAFLQQHGSDMVFFPYTDGISSTELKERVGGIGRKGEDR